jgi:hypothetical protein
MPEPTLNELLDQYGGEAASGHYGVAVVTAVDAAMQNEGVRDAISPITMSTIAALEVAAHEVLIGGASLEALANLAIKTAMDLAGQLAAEALEAVGGVVPIIGAAFEFLVGLQDAAKERARAERIAAARQAFKRCRETADAFEPIGTGPFNEIYPCDLFVQARPVHGGWQASNPPRVPYLGQMLRLMTESRWPGWLLHYIGTIGGGRFTDRPELWGYAKGSPIWQNLNGSDSHPFNDRLPAGAGDWWPELGWYVPEFQRLSSAIAKMHPYERAQAGLPAGDGGKSLWALYQDLLYAILNKPRHPFTDPGRPSYPITDSTNFASWAPVLPKDGALMLYGGSVRYVESEPQSLGVPHVFEAIDYIRSQGGKVPANYDSRRLTHCGGQPTKTVEAIYDMAAGWNLWTNPRHYTDQQKMKDAIQQSARFASKFARGRLQQLGITKPSTGGASAARQTIGALAANGVISESQASEVAGAVNNGADSGRLALMIGATAVGAGALAWVLS